MNYTNNIPEMCYVECSVLHNRIQEFQGAFSQMEVILFLNIVFFVLFYFYLCLNNYYNDDKQMLKLLEGFFILIKFFSFYVFAVDLFYLYLFLI